MGAIKGIMRGVQKAMKLTGINAVGQKLRTIGSGSSGINRFTNWMARNNKGKDVAVGLKSIPTNVTESIQSKIPPMRKRTSVMRAVHATVSSPASLAMQATIGASAMVGLSMMSGGVGKAQDIMAQRYMQDSRYSSRLLAQSSVGRASANSTFSLGNHVGLSLSMHKGRHG